MSRSDCTNVIESGFAGIHLIPVDKLKPLRYHTRHEAFDDICDLESLAESIRSVGLVELPIVRRVAGENNDFYFEIIAGHRRISAVTKYLGWEQVKCSVYDNIDEITALTVALSENLHRSNLSAYEEGMSYMTCQRIFGLSDTQVAGQLRRAKRVVVSRKLFAKSANNCLKYLQETEVVRFLQNYTLGHYELLTQVKDISRISDLVRLIKDGITVKELKAAVSHSKGEEKTEAGDHDSKIRARSNKTELMNQLQSEITRLKEEAPDGFRSRIYLLEDIIDEIDFLNKHGKMPMSQLSSADRSTGDRDPPREISCPSCGERLWIKRRLNEREKSVLFLIHKAKDEGDSPSVVSFPKLS